MNIKIKELTVKRDGQIILENLSVDFSDKQITALVGVSGSGKTTLLHALAGLVPLDSGVIEPKLQAQDVALVMQEHGLFPWKTVKQNIELARINKGQKTQWLHELVAELGLESLLNRYPHQLSGGQSQRVAIARALYQEAKVILMDEATASLDEVTQLKWQQLLKKVQSHYPMTIIYVTHRLQEAVALSQRIVLLSKGKIVEVVDADETMTLEQRESLLRNKLMQLMEDEQDVNEI
ncbi:MULTISPECIES: ATP-binding cassette domain-containing protein [unclassified Facklamia]|uniref:ABC transporter ATP-binding protein n=1 Tax=Aerococcaceae TaxID=186827 RepID=UPI0013BDE005|nr:MULTISPECIES: ATP-binding cassette domain-containing protein [unclassified Facklamia]NEW64114.1 ATP-binding cassette domain-containing protein [Facklamia sp. 252]NEW67571.1 ATP-binding cassette domain-containing protein [Facklamia sp. 253]QQD65820.1 ATP-binding cassette domain-containing protein [Aerococcaceae bacterium zg-252]